MSSVRVLVLPTIENEMSQIRGLWRLERRLKRNKLMSEMDRNDIRTRMIQILEFVVHDGLPISGSSYQSSQDWLLLWCINIRVCPTTRIHLVKRIELVCVKFKLYYSCTKKQKIQAGCKYFSLLIMKSETFQEPVWVSKRNFAFVIQWRITNPFYLISNFINFIILHFPVLNIGFSGYK